MIWPTTDQPTTCAPPDPAFAARTFDIDIYNCPCGHLYGAHEYEYVDRSMKIGKCLDCEETHG